MWVPAGPQDDTLHLSAAVCNRRVSLVTNVQHLPCPVCNNLRSADEQPAGLKESWLLGRRSVEGPSSTFIGAAANLRSIPAQTLLQT